MDSVNPQAPPVPLSAGLGLKIYRYRSLIRRHWWVMAITVALGLAYEAYVILSKPQLFESNSELLIREELSTEAGKSVSFDDKAGRQYDTYIMLLKSDTTLTAARSKLMLEAPELSGKVDINASVPPRTNIFTITGTGSNGEYTRRFVDAVVQEFMDSRKLGRSSQVDTTKQGLESDLKEMKAELEKKQGQFQAFVKDNNMAFWQEQAKSSASFLSGLKNQQAQLQNELLRLENLSPDELLVNPGSGVKAPAAPQGAPTAGGGASSGVSNAPFNNELYVQYTQATQQLVQRQAEVEYWKTVWKPKHPKLQAMQTKVEDLQRLISTIKEQNTAATAARKVAIKAELKSLESTTESWQKKVTEASGKDAEYTNLQNQIASLNSQIERISNSNRDINVHTSADPLTVMHPATPPKAVPPGTVKHLLIGLIGGFAVGLIILVLMDRADDRVSSSTEMLDHFSEPILGQIPNVADTRKETGLPLLQPEDERYTYAEAFRSLRSSLIFMPNQAELRTILITSAIPNEGKSTIASNLAVTMAASGARVLLVDADLRRGDLAQLFDTDGRFGLSSILRGEVPWKEAVQTTKYPTLSLIPRGPVTNQSGELLLKPEVASLLEQFKEQYDLVIFNTAPILAADDTPTLAPNFDGALMVVRASFTSARLSKNALNMLYQRQVNILGLILNCIDAEMPDYYYYRYPKYYAAS
ncbi:MAG TPA: polysaccharide biosynthesis tyrosine autokinase [Chthoniobacter sp.]|nr:polysaccharide biosynthesis tyrosine autokinase [Chthoniobacter sp.]